MGLFSKDEPLTAATVRSFDRIPDRPAVDALRDGDLWRIYRCVPEVHYAVNQQARLIGRLDWRVEGDGQELADGDEIMRKAFGADLRSLSVMAGIHLQVVGRYWLVRAPGTNGRNGWQIMNSPMTSEQKKVAEKADVLVEVMIEDPAIPGRADSPVAAVRDIATELILTRAQARATARSRTAQTMMVLYPKEGAGPNAKKFEDGLANVVTAPLSDEKAESVAVPNIVGFPADFIEKWRVLDLTGPIDDKLHDRIERLIRQLAIGLDMAPSVLLGLEDSNQWSAYASLEDNWLGHVEPLAAPVGQSFAEALTKAAQINRDRIEVVPDPAPLLRRRPPISDVITAAQLGIVTFEWAAEQLGAPVDAVGPRTTAQEEVTAGTTPTGGEPSVETSQNRQLTTGAGSPTTAAAPPGVDGARLADIDEQAYTSLEDLIRDIAERALEKLGAKIRSMAQGRNMDLPDDIPNADLARQFTGVIPNAQATIEQVATDAISKVSRVIERAQGRLRALGIEVPPEPEPEGLSAAQAAFITAVAATVGAQQAGGTGIADAWQAAREVATIAGGGEPQDFRQAASGIALAASTMDIIRRDFGVEPPTGPGSHRWLHLYQGPDPHPVHLSLKDALFNGVSVFAGGYEAFPGDHAGAVAADTIVSGPRALAAALRYRHGPMVELSTARGKQLTITPDHPVLTQRGWVQAGELEVSDHLVGGSFLESASPLVPDVAEADATAHDVLRALWLTPGVRASAVPVSAEQLDGEPVTDPDVAVVLADHDLGVGGQATVGEPAGHEELGRADVAGAVPVARDGGALQRLLAVRAPSLGLVRRGGSGFALLGGDGGVADDLLLPRSAFGDALVGQERVDRDTGDVVRPGQFQDARALAVLAHDAFNVQVTPGAFPGGPEAEVGKAPVDGGLSEAHGSGDLGAEHPGLVEFDQVRGVRLVPDWQGHVLDFQTLGSWYTGNGITVHNCQCIAAPADLVTVRTGWSQLQPQN